MVVMIQSSNKLFQKEAYRHGQESLPFTSFGLCPGPQLLFIFKMVTVVRVILDQAALLLSTVLG